MIDGIAMQEYIFLEAFFTKNVALTRRQILENMRTIDSKKFQSDKHVESPLQLSQLFSRAEGDRLISRASPSTWKLTQAGEEAKHYKFVQFIAPALKIPA